MAKMVTECRVERWCGRAWVDDLRITTFSQGSMTVNAKVDSNHILRRHRKYPSFDLGGLEA